MSVCRHRIRGFVRSYVNDAENVASQLQALGAVDGDVRHFRTAMMEWGMFTAAHVEIADECECDQEGKP